jgi:vacuolar protein sorting-associated protein VTA1
MNPGSWSTVATPGTADHRTFDFPVSPPTGDPRRATVSGEVEGPPEQHPSPEDSLFGDPNIRRPTQPPYEQAPPQQQPQSSEPGSTLPSEIVPTHTESYTGALKDTAVDTTPQPPIQSYQQISQPTATPPIPTQQQQFRTIRNVAPPPQPPTAPVPPPQLTPKQIAQAQKHCRYAISALDYEDFERARQDLMDALRIIDG